MQEFQTNGRTFSGYLAVPEQDSGPGVIVLHAWWGLNDVFKQVCDRLAEAGFVALAPDLYHGKTTAAVEEAQALSASLNQDEERVCGDIEGAVQVLRQHDATAPADSRGKLAFVGFSLGGAYALDRSVRLTEEIAAVVTYYATYPGLDYSRAPAAYLCHFAEDDPFEPAEQVRQFEEELHTAGRQASFFTYPGTHHWFVEDNRPEYEAEAAELAWQRTIEFLHQQLG